jgi:hypothetical protein
MSCSTCQQVEPAPCCSTTLVIGTIADASVSVSVYFKNITTNRLLILPGTSDGSGLVSVDVSDEQFATNQSFEIWVTLATGNMNDKKDITVNTTTADCLAAQFYRVNNESDVVVNSSTFTISIA